MCIKHVKRNSVPDWGIPSSDGTPLCLRTLFVLLPLPKVAFAEVKHSEGKIALDWYFRKSFL